MLMRSADKRGWSIAAIAVVIAGCRLVPDPQPLQFGKVYVGTLSPVLTARWVNQHDSQDAEVLGFQVQAPYIAVSPPPAHVVPHGQASQPIQVQFAPSAPGPFPEEVRVLTHGPKAVALDLRGEGVWQIAQGHLHLGNRPPDPLGVATTTPILPTQPIDWGTRRLGNPPVDALFQVHNSGPAITGTAKVRLLKGDQHFAITFPAGCEAMDIAANGARPITVTFTPEAVGEWMDVVEVIDTTDPRTRAGIVLRARVVEGGD
jgi:hypothetical protein